MNQCYSLNMCNYIMIALLKMVHVSVNCIQYNCNFIHYAYETFVFRKSD